MSIGRPGGGEVGHTGSRELKLDPNSQELGWGPRAKYRGNWGQKRNLVFFRTP
jgi:hypothetical protein